jgi:hypothetical protein
MTLVVTHKFTDPHPDGPVTTIVRPSNWNDTHTITGTVDATLMPALTGDVTTSAGSVATTIAANAVTNAKFRQEVGLSLVGVTGNTTANRRYRRDGEPDSGGQQRWHRAGLRHRLRRSQQRNRRLHDHQCRGDLREDAKRRGVASAGKSDQLAGSPV